MGRSPQLYLVCYDIRWSDATQAKAGQRRLARVHRILRGFGDWVQHSVFLCALSEVQRAHLEAELQAVVNHRQDQVLLVHLGTAGARTSWRTHAIGVPLQAPERSCRIIG